MTLVVARIIENQIVILSDTKITSPQETLQGLDNHILKAVIINPNLCICYAQTIRKALKVIRGLNSLPNAELEKIQDYLLQKHRIGGNDPDFMIASLNPNPSLHKISDGKILSLPVAWLGNQEAFNDYQKYYGELSNSIDIQIRPSVKMYMAFNRIASRGKYDDIGEFIIEVKNEKTGFKYMQYASGVSAVRLNAKGDVSSVSHGTVSEGGYSYSVFTPQEAGIGAIGIHFYQGMLGVLFYPTKQEKPIRYPNVNTKQFKSKVQQEFGFEIVGDNLVE